MDVFGLHLKEPDASGSFLQKTMKWDRSVKNVCVLVPWHFLKEKFMICFRLTHVTFPLGIKKSSCPDAPSVALQ